MGWRLGDDIPQELVDIEPDDKTKPNEMLFIDSGNMASITKTIIVLITLIAVHLFAAFRTPELISYQDEYFSTNGTGANLSVDVDITLSELLHIHKFVDVNCTLIRKEPASQETSQSIESSSRIVFFKSGASLNAVNLPKQTSTVVFLPDRNISSSIPVIHKEIQDFDAVQIKTTLKSNFVGIKGLNFHWSFANPSAITYSKAACIIMSVLIGYMLIVNLSHATFQEKYTEVFCIVLGVVGVFASNPFSLVMSSEKMKFVDQVFMHYFIALFRYFLLMEIEVVRSHKSSPGVLISAVLGVFFAVYAIIDTNASYDRAQLIENSLTVTNGLLQSEQMLAYAHIAYAVIMVLFMTLASVQYKEHHTRRLVILEIFSMTGLLAAVFSQILCPKASWLALTIVPRMVNAVIHMTMCAFVIFLMHQNSGIEYEQMNVLGDGDESVGGLDVEEISENETSDEEDDGEEEEY